MMTGTQIIRIYYHKWYTTFTFYVTGPQKPIFVLMLGRFCNFWPPLCPHEMSVSLGVWQGWEYGFRGENVIQKKHFFSGTIVSRLCL